ncbi:MAG: hypothetical protein J6D21_06435 [Clostridia bacterium]|nr:hypothetical protein [Clostridia bacterium]
MIDLFQKGREAHFKFLIDLFPKRSRGVGAERPYSFCLAFFKKRVGCRATPCGNGLSFLQSFFLWPFASKKKAFNKY